ncbi:MAG: hypothetical protein H6757_03355 [Candidatus Omnitrophica bacterium]|nr:hypothetical protein [Candidatus Omnitrophota bacterium]
MMRLFIYLLVAGIALYLFWSWRNQGDGSDGSAAQQKSKYRFRGKRDPRELWVQVYETASLEEGRNIQARIQEEDIECVLYEQGRRDIHGNDLLGFGISVPKTSMSRAQDLISRMPV